jgi:hypothetical protein
MYGEAESRPSCCAIGVRTKTMNGEVILSTRRAVSAT